MQNGSVMEHLMLFWRQDVLISGCLVCKKLKACKNFSFVKTHMGNGKMIEAIINSIEEGRLPFPGEIVKYVESYMNSIE